MGAVISRCLFLFALAEKNAHSRIMFSIENELRFLPPFWKQGANNP